MNEQSVSAESGDGPTRWQWAVGFKKVWNAITHKHSAAVIAAVMAVIGIVGLFYLAAQTRAIQEQLTIQRNQDRKSDRIRLIEVLFERGKYNPRTRAQALKEYIKFEREGPPKRWDVDLAAVQLQDCVIPQHDWRGITLAQANFNGGEFEHANFEGVNLYRAQMVQSRFPAGKFKKANLTAANLAGATLVAADFSDAQLNSAAIGGAEALQADFTGASLLNVSADYFLDKPTDLMGARFIRARLKDGRFDRTKLNGADFTGADLSGAVFSACDLSGAVFRDAMVSGTDFSGSFLTSVDFTGAKITNCNIAAAAITNGVKGLGLP